MSAPSPANQQPAPVFATRLASIRRRLDRLKAAAPVPDRGGPNGWPRVFGSDGHQWTGTPVELAELADLEAFLGARLPPEISAFYTLVGHGVGPNYGLWPPQRIRAAVALDREDFADEGLPLLDIGGPFPITARDLAAQMPPIRPNPLPGSVRFCERGCGYYSALALTGELAGTVWDVEGSDWSPGAEWWPARVPRQHELPSGPVHFFDWYEDWLTDSEQRLGLT